MQLNKLIDKVIEKVEEREDKALGRFGLDVDQVIYSAMEQFRDVVNDNKPVLATRIKALTWALEEYINETSRLSYSLYERSEGGLLLKKDLNSTNLDTTKLRISPYNKGSFKCNKLVADAYAVGGEVGLSIGKNWGGRKIKGKGYPAKYDYDSGVYMWGPKANGLSKLNHNLRSFTYARAIREHGEIKAQPELGDIICFPYPEGLGHSSLYLGKGLIISAKFSGIEVETELYEKEKHDDIARVRKFTGSGR